MSSANAEKKKKDEEEEAAKQDAIAEAVATADRRVKEKLGEKTGSAQGKRDRTDELEARRESFAGCKSLTAKMAMGSQWFDDRDPSELQQLLGLSEEKDCCAGHLVDYLERSRAVEMRLLARTVAAKSSLSYSQQSMVNTMNRGFNDNKYEVQYEKLKEELMKTFIQFWREQGNKEWAPQGVACLMKHAAEIVKGKQKKKCLIIDVDYYDMKYKLKHTAAKGLEHQDERHSRLRDFFKQYHGSPSKVDLQMSSSNGQLRLIQSNPKAAHKAFVKSLAKKQHSDDMADAPVIKSHELENLPTLSKVDNWKVRNARGRSAPLGMDRSRAITREFNALPSPTPTSPLGRSGSSILSPMSTATSSFGAGSPNFGGSTTLSGGWGLDGRWPRDARRHHTAEAIARADQEPVESQLRRCATAAPAPLDRQHRRADNAFRGIMTASRTQQQRASSAGRPDSRGSPLGGGGSRPSSRGSNLPTEKSGGGGDLTHSRSAPTLPARLNSGDLSQIDMGSPQSGLSGLQRNERNPFVSPWRGSGKRMDHLASAAEPPTVKYLRESELNFVAPKLIPFITGHSDGLKAKDQGLNDCDLLVIGTMVPGKAVISEVDLDGNSLLTERSLVPFLQKLYGQPVDRLNLNRCLHYALPPGIKETLDVVESLLSDTHGLTNLRFLDLSGIKVGLRSQVPLCQAIQEHIQLTDVRLASTGIGGSVAKECIGQLMSSATIQTLDLSWNSFNTEVFTQLGERLAGMFNLQSLSVANCSSSQYGLDNPVAFFLEYLSRNAQLTHLDVSANRITFRGAVVLEDAMEQHRKLSELTISNNPIGVLGIRCLFRLLSRDSSGLIHFTMDGVAGGTPLEVLSENMQMFRAASPGGSYVFNLARPYHRSLLRMLYKTCERFGISPDLAFRDISYVSATKGGWSHPQKDGDGIYAVPFQGTLTCIFNIVSATDGPLKGLAEDSFDTFLHKYQDRARLKVGFKKIVPMLAYWKGLDGRSAEQVYMLEALSKDFAFDWQTIEVLCRSRPMTCEILWRLVPSIIGGMPCTYIPTRGALNLTDYMNIYHKAFLLESFNPDNPTGRYKLNLENPSDFLVAEQIVLLDRWEMSVAKKLDRADVSQKGNWSHCRNEKFAAVPIQNVQSMMEWGMPEWDTLELDYVSSKRPPHDAVNLDDAAWERVLVSTQLAGCSKAWQVQAFRKVSHHFYVSAIQARQLLNIFGALDVRSDIFVMIYPRLTDICNEKLARTRFDAVTEVPALRMRLGHLTLFPFIQPEQSYFEFDLAYYDERLALVTLLQLATKEHQGTFMNIHEFEYRDNQGNKKELPQGISPSWTYMDKIETSGTFKCTYVCGPEDRKLPERRIFMKDLGFWRESSFNDTDVNWWASMAQASEDVIEFLDFIVARYDNVFDAFTVIDGEDGNKNISLREFEEGIMKMKCRKFKGKNKKERIENVFRYLDPTGEGQVSELEWGALQLLYKDIYLAIREFAWFLKRTFASFEAAWLFLDKDGSGALDLQEWLEASESIGYYGPCRPIFAYLDKDDEGTISQEEFQVLKEVSSD